MMGVMRKCLTFGVLSAFLVLSLISCNMALGTPEPKELLSFLTGEFTCGFLLSEDGEVLASASYVRETGCDTLTYEKNGQRVVFRFEGGESYLCTAASETEDALILPVTLSNEHGAAQIREMFSLFPTEEDGESAWSVTCVGEGYQLTYEGADTELVWTFSHELVPISVVCGNMTCVITSYKNGT